MNSEREYLTHLLKGYRRMYWRGHKLSWMMVHRAHEAMKSRVRATSRELGVRHG